MLKQCWHIQYLQVRIFVFKEALNGIGDTQHEFRRDDFAAHHLSHPLQQRSQNQNQNRASADDL